MTNGTPPSFSRSRKWNLSLNTAVVLVSVLALAVMINYLAARHFGRVAWSSSVQTKLSPRTQQVLSLVSNDVKIILYFDQREPVYDLSWSLLKSYAFANSRISLETVDYTRNPAAAQLVKAKYQLGDQTDRDIVIFYCQGRKHVVHQNELSDLDTQALISGQGREVRRTHFKGELMFTSALFTVINPRQPKAYFLQGHGEHDVESDEGVTGFSKFGGVLRESAVQFDKLSLEGSGEVPPDCNLLIIAGPHSALMPGTLDKIDRYLNKGGRLLALFSYPPRRTGLEQTLANWGVSVGQNLVSDPKAVVRQNDMVVATYSTHPLIKPLHQLYQLYLILPRSIEPLRSGGSAADAPQVEPLFFTTSAGRIADFKPDGEPYLTGREVSANVSLAVAVEKGGVRNVSADRGATRIVVVGDSYFLANDNIDSEANRQFASQAINWLLARNELLSGLAPRPIQEYKLTMTVSQERAMRWLLLLVMPGTVLLLGFLVWVRRRR
jgi:hypothetical protein